MKPARAAVLMVGLAVFVGCEKKPAQSSPEALNCGDPRARAIAEQLGRQLKQVSLTAPDSQVRKQLRDSYAPFVTIDLMDRWLTQPSLAPGRAVSSPWPDRIDVASVKAEDESTCVVDGQIAYVTSAEQAPGAAFQRVPVTLRVVKNNTWRVSAFEAQPVAAPPAESATDSTPADVIREYYAAINAHDYQRAYAMWGDSGRNSHQTFEQFRNGFSETATVHGAIGEPGPIEGAAGSRYVDIPVVISATKKDGTKQKFRGKYTLRRSVVTGATEAQQRWHIYSAEIARSR